MASLTVCRTVGILEDSSKRFRRFLISFWDEMRVHIEGCARISMAQSSGDGTDIHPGGEEARRYVVPEIVQANFFDASLPTDPPKCSRCRSGCQGEEPSTE